MVRFILFCIYHAPPMSLWQSQFHYGSIHTKGWIREVNYKFDLNSTMVRFIHSEIENKKVPKDNLNSTMVRFIQGWIRQLEYTFEISIPLWFDSYI